jgi:hypothetical protein
MRHLRYSDGEMPRTNRRRDRMTSSVASVSASPSVARRERGMPNLDADEPANLRSVERGEWTTVARLPAARARYARDAKATLRRLRQS